MEKFHNYENINKSFLKNTIKNILNTSEQEFHKNISELFLQNLNDDNIKYVIKLISYYTKNANNKEMKIKCFELFKALINNITQKNIIICLTNILLYMQENISTFEVHIFFEIMMSKINEMETKNFEILNGFCLINLKKEENIIQEEALNCYHILLQNFVKLKPNDIKDKAVKSILETMKLLILDKLKKFDYYLLLGIINDIINISKEKISNYIEVILSRIFRDLPLNDDDIKLVLINFINAFIDYCPHKKNEIKHIIYPYLNEFNKNKDFKHIINKIIYDETTNVQKRKNKNAKIIKVKKAFSNRSFNDEDKYYKNKMKNLNQSSDNNTNYNQNIKCEIYVNKKSFPLNNFKNTNNKKDLLNNKKLNLSTFRKEDDYLNPIQLWHNCDNNNNSNKKNKKENICLININESINGNINIINEKKEESKLDLIIDKIIKISNNQNALAEKIINLDKNTKKQISYFEERLYQLENKELNEEIINKRMIILYPSNSANEKISEFITSNNSDKAIFFLNSVTEVEIEFIDNNLIEDVIDKLIFFINNNIYIRESIIFIKKIFVKNKKRFNLDIYKKLLRALDLLLKSDIKLSDQISFDISLIISSIESKKI